MEVKKCCPVCFKREGFEYYHESDNYEGSKEYFICKKCGRDIDVYRMKEFQRLLNEESTRYLNEQKEQYANARVLEELEYVMNEYKKDELYAKLYMVIENRIKELKEVKQ
jgi:hypothetical protein